MCYKRPPLCGLSFQFVNAFYRWTRLINFNVTECIHLLSLVSAVHTLSLLHGGAPPTPVQPRGSQRRHLPAVKPPASLLNRGASGHKSVLGSAPLTHKWDSEETVPQPKALARSAFEMRTAVR